MKKLHVALASLLALGVPTAGYLMAHESTNEWAAKGHVSHHHDMHMMGSGMMGSGMMGSGMMGSGMMSHSEMSINHSMFDLDQISAQLQLTAEQVSLLSQLEATHVQMQTTMQSARAESEGSISHMQMMSVMVENADLMAAHIQNYADFEKTLSAEQATLWEKQGHGCH